MKFSLSLLKEHVSLHSTVEEMCNALTARGLELEYIEGLNNKLDNFHVVEVVDVVKHENADHLNVCNIKKVNGDHVQVICGAPNVRSGIKAIFADVGSIIPSTNSKLRKSVIRGRESCGMLCSEAELCIGSGDSVGIIEVSNDEAIGKSATDIFGVSDPVICINITPNRGDCLSIQGIARELIAAGLADPLLIGIKSINLSLEPSVKVTVETPDCLEFSYLIIEDIQNCETPKVIKNKLNALGINSISTAVDISNYVMLEYGRPMHVYDLDAIRGDVVVRKAKSGEELELLNGKSVKLDSSMTVIADSTLPLCLGGIMGGLRSSVTETTTTILLECAVFEASSIARTGRHLDIMSDSRYRFERGVDRSMSTTAITKAANMILELCGGKVSKIVNIVKIPVVDSVINFDRDAVLKLGGIDLSYSNIDSILKDIGFSFRDDDGKSVKLNVPSWRHDLSLTEDIVNEIARSIGYEAICSVSIAEFRNSNSYCFNYAETVNAICYSMRSLLSSKGMIEAITWSFNSIDKSSLFGDIKNDLKIDNPISEDMSYLKSNAVIGLVNIVANNENRGYHKGAVFEIGNIFYGSEPANQSRVISGIRWGSAVEKNHFGEIQRDFDVFDIKADLYACLDLLNVSTSSIKYSHNVPVYYHPGISSSLLLGNKIIANFGELHPIIRSHFGLSAKSYIFELFLDALGEKKIIKFNSRKGSFKQIKLKPITRDFSIIIDRSITATDIVAATRSCSNMISDIHIFDLYESDNFGQNKKSVAFNVKIMQGDDNMKSDQIEAICTDISNKMKESFDAKIR